RELVVVQSEFVVPKNSLIKDPWGRGLEHYDITDILTIREVEGLFETRNDGYEVRQNQVFEDEHGRCVVERKNYIDYSGGVRYSRFTNGENFWYQVPSKF